MLLSPQDCGSAYSAGGWNTKALKGEVRDRICKFCGWAEQQCQQKPAHKAAAWSRMVPTAPSAEPGRESATGKNDRAHLCNTQKFKKGTVLQVWRTTVCTAEDNRIQLQPSGFLKALPWLRRELHHFTNDGIMQLWFPRRHWTAVSAMAPLLQQNGMLTRSGAVILSCNTARPMYFLSLPWQPCCQVRATAAAAVPTARLWQEQLLTSFFSF